MSEALLKAGASILTELGPGTPLHCAARNAHTDVIKLLVDCGANVLAQDSQSFAPVGRATQANHIAARETPDELALVARFLRSGADIVPKQNLILKGFASKIPVNQTTKVRPVLIS